MSLAVESYLDQVLLYAKLSDEAADNTRQELRDHLVEKVAVYEREGLAREDAVFRAIEDLGTARVVGYRLRPRWKLVDIRREGTARGFIAVGPRAIGVVASGGIAVGVFAFGGVAIGVFSIGGLAAALVFAWAGIGIVPLGVSYAGLGLGAVSVGGFAVGLVAIGGLCVGFWVPHANTAWSYYDAQTVPALLYQMEEAAAGIDWTWITICLLGIWFASAIASAVAFSLERRRLGPYDPAVVE